MKPFIIKSIQPNVFKVISPSSTMQNRNTLTDMIEWAKNNNIEYKSDLTGTISFIISFNNPEDSMKFLMRFK